MKTSQLILASVLALTGVSSAFAGSPAYIADGPDLFAREAQAAQASTLTRAQVQRTVAQAQAANGFQAISDRPDLFADVTGSSVSRDQVKSQLAQARANGELQNFSDYPVFTDAMVGKSLRTREEVRAETVNAIRAQ